MKQLTNGLVKIGLISALFASLLVLATGVWFQYSQTTAQAVSQEKADEDTVIRISPPTRRIDLDPGGVYNKDKRGDYTVRVVNRGKKAFVFTMSVKPYSMKDSKYEDISYDNQTSYTQISRWITFPQVEYKLKAGEAVDVPFVVTVPEDVPAGGQYAVIFASTTGSQKVSDGRMINAIYQPGMLVLGHVNGETREEGKVQSMEIKSFQPPKRVAGVNEHPVTGTATVKNSGNTDFTVSSSMTINGIFTDKEVAKVKTQEFVVFPETERQLSLSWKDSPQVGIYKIRQTLTVLGKKHQITKVVLVISPTVVVIAAIILVLLAVGLIVFFRRQRGKSGKKPRATGRKLRFRAHEGL